MLRTASSIEIVCTAACLFAFGGCGTEDDDRGSGGGGIQSAGGGASTSGESDEGSPSGGVLTEGAADGESGDDGPGGTPKLDVGPPPTGELPCDGAGQGVGGMDFSYIWIANSPEGTISKINTVTLVEEGRYRTRDTFGDPSRTSVALSGHMAVANRAGGITKYYAYDCPDPVNTSTGPGDVYPFGDDGCLAWSVNMPYDSQRPIAWTPGNFNENNCTWENEYVWTSGYNGGGTVEAILVDGETGAIVDQVTVNNIQSDMYGAYGGASDGEGNFWFSQLGTGRLVRVPINNLAGYEVWQMPITGYGMAVDNQDRAWICGNNGVARFNYGSQTWDTLGWLDAGGISRGCMADQTHIWLAGAPNLRGINLDTMVLDYNWPVPSYVHGTSIDFQGFVWGVSRDTRAYRVDPATGAVDTVDGLNSPYTYSDMTGFGLANAVGPVG